MFDRVIGAVIVLFVGVAIVAFYKSYEMETQCRERGGVMVKGFWGATCIKAERIPE